jgi:aspartyl protease family protein
VIGGWFFVSQRGNLGKLVQYAAIWSFIFLGAIVAVGLWTDIRQTVVPRQSVMMDGARVEVPRHSDGHYYLTMEVNGTPIRFVVDTGATELVLSPRGCRTRGARPDALIFRGRPSPPTAWCRPRRSCWRPSRLARRSTWGFAAVVNGAEMQDSLLGMSYLQHFDRIEISDGRWCWNARRPWPRFRPSSSSFPFPPTSISPPPPPRQRPPLRAGGFHRAGIVAVEEDHGAGMGRDLLGGDIGPFDRDEAVGRVAAAPVVSSTG